MQYSMADFHNIPAELTILDLESREREKAHSAVKLLR